MRLRHAGGRTVHLGYCTNVHPAEDLAGIVAQLDTYAVPVRETLGADPLGLGLWLAAPVAAQLAADPAARRRLRTELTVRGLEVVTLNGFPYAAFQAPVVKGAVYRPDWTTDDRLGYTLDLARVLADLLPDEAARGSVSTLPLAWRAPWDRSRADSARRRLDQLASGLAAVERETGRPVRVGFEPEPGCVVESTPQAVAVLSGMDTDRLGICLDLAHLACAWEEPAAALERLAVAGLPVVKVQVSAALEAADPTADAAALRRWVEPRFLHQTRTAGCAAATPTAATATAPTAGAAATPAGGPQAADPADPRWAADDLDAALDAALPGPWRVHYHVPLHAPPEPPLGSTLPVLRAALAALFAGADAGCDHLDVETYTWGVLPAARRPRTDAELAAGIAAELAFTRDELVALGLTLLSHEVIP
jgi:sugar phosphate isomerase/epimerase